MCRSHRHDTPSYAKIFGAIQIDGENADDEEDIVAAVNHQVLPSQEDETSPSEGSIGDELEDDPDAARCARIYEGIFLFAFPRRSDRILVEEDIPTFIRDFWSRCFVMSEDLSTAEEASHSQTIADAFDRPLDEIVEYSPPRLDLDSWVGKEVLKGWTALPDFEGGELRAYGTWVADLQARNVAQSAERGLKMLYIGEATPGRLIWFASSQVLETRTEAEAVRVATIRRCLQRLERILLRLARVIADKLATALVLEYAVSFAALRPMLSRSQVESAVREILGREWFHLPYDDGGVLRDWSPRWDAFPEDRLDQILRRD